MNEGMYYFCSVIESDIHTNKVEKKDKNNSLFSCIIKKVDLYLSKTQSNEKSTLHTCNSLHTFSPLRVMFNVSWFELSESFEE